jgi:hypothetical protein
MKLVVQPYGSFPFAATNIPTDPSVPRCTSITQSVLHVLGLGNHHQVRPPVVELVVVVMIYSARITIL